MNPRLHFMNRHQCIGLCCNIAMVDTAGEVGAVEMRAIGDAYKFLARTYPRVGGLCVLRPGAAMSTPEGRQEAGKFAKELGSTLALVSIVIEAEGVVAQMFRSSMRVFSVFSRNPPLAVAEDLDEGIQALGAVLHSPSSRDQGLRELRQAFLDLRAAYLPAESA